MKTFRVKSLIEGYKIDAKFTGQKLVAVKVEWKDYWGKWFKQANPFRIYVVGNTKYYTEIKDWEKEMMSKSNPFKDKFGRDKVSEYVLGYFKWNPKDETQEGQLKLLEEAPRPGVFPFSQS